MHKKLILKGLGGIAILPLPTPRLPQLLVTVPQVNLPTKLTKLPMESLNPTTNSGKGASLFSNQNPFSQKVNNFGNNLGGGLVATGLDALTSSLGLKPTYKVNTGLESVMSAAESASQNFGNPLVNKVGDALAGGIGKLGGLNMDKMVGSTSGVNAVSNVLSNFGPVGMVASVALKSLNMLGGKNLENLKLNSRVALSGGYSGSVGLISEIADKYGGGAVGGLDVLLGKDKKYNEKIREQQERLRRIKNILNQSDQRLMASTGSADMFRIKNEVEMNDKSWMFNGVLAAKQGGRILRILKALNGVEYKSLDEIPSKENYKIDAQNEKRAIKNWLVSRLNLPEYKDQVTFDQHKNLFNSKAYTSEGYADELKDYYTNYSKSRYGPLYKLIMFGYKNTILDTINGQVNDHKSFLRGVNLDGSTNIFVLNPNDKSVIVHELTHALGVNKPLHEVISKIIPEHLLHEVSEDAILKYINFYKNNKPSEWATSKIARDEAIDYIRGNNYDNDYYNKPTEVYSRLMLFRLDNNLDPNKKYTIDDINNFRKDPNIKDIDILLRYKPELVLRLLNEVADNTNNKNRVNNIISAQKGVKLNNTKKETPIISEETEKMSLIPEGALHARKHNLDVEDITKKGIPIISEEDGGVVQHAEIEKNEIIFTKSITDQLEELRKQYNESESKKEKDEIAIRAGELITFEIIENTDDRTGLITEVE